MKKKTKKINSLLVAIVSILSFNNALAQSDFLAPEYGVPLPPSRFEIILNLIKFAAVIFIPIALVIGIVIYIVKKRKKITPIK